MALVDMFDDMRRVVMKWQKYFTFGLASGVKVLLTVRYGPAATGRSLLLTRDGRSNASTCQSMFLQRSSQQHEGDKCVEVENSAHFSDLMT